MSTEKVVSQAEWLKVRKELLQKEKEFTRLRDEISARRRQLPWVKVEKTYLFEGPDGAIKLIDLFNGRTQLFIYHFMLGPGWKEGCPSCSYLADTFDAVNIHMPHRDTAFAAISRATWPEIEAFKKRMQWRFPWFSSFGTDFNQDFRVSFTKEEMQSGEPIYNFGTIPFPSEEAPGASTFIRRGHDVFHTYSTYSRGLDILIPTYNFLDMTAKGRDEDSLPHSMAWVRHHDRYVDNKMVNIGSLAKSSA